MKLVSIKQMEDVFDGCAYLVYCGTLYETLGVKKGERFGFSCISDGSVIWLLWETLMSKECEVEY